MLGLLRRAVPCHLKSWSWILTSLSRPLPLSFSLFKVKLSHEEWLEHTLNFKKSMWREGHRKS